MLASHRDWRRISIVRLSCRSPFAIDSCRERSDSIALALSAVDDPASIGDHSFEPRHEMQGSRALISGEPFSM
jgi:hypothetical protein